MGARPKSRPLGFEFTRARRRFIDNATDNFMG